MNRLLCSVLLSILVLAGCTRPVHKRLLSKDMIFTTRSSILSDSIMYHKVRVDGNGNILPWYGADLGESYDHVLHLVWEFWNHMRIDSNGLKYYMNHAVWLYNQDDRRGIGGDQIAMALSSWNLYYDYTGDDSVLNDMKYMADYYLAHSLSPTNCQWPNLPYPYNTNVESGIYDGDMILGKGYLQPDKAGSFGFELVHLYKKTGDEKYLNAAINIANTLAAKVQKGDNNHSPWPFKVNALTGKIGILVHQDVWYEGMSKDSSTWNNPKNTEACYTTNWTGTLGLFRQLIALGKGESKAYQKAFNITLNWMKEYPLKTNKWGPFFEDVPGWSDTQINAITCAMYILNHPDLFPNWEGIVRDIFDWVHKNLDNKEYIKYGVTPINEQTVYRVPGNSHSSREASVELMYWEKTGDTTYTRNDIRMLNWATYMVNNNGENCYPTDSIWMTDGYGDYVRHYLRAMGAAPQLAPPDANRMLHSSSIVKKISYRHDSISYTVFDSTSEDVFRLISKPEEVKVNGGILKKASDSSPEGWTWQPLHKGGILRIKQAEGNKIQIFM